MSRKFRLIALGAVLVAAAAAGAQELTVTGAVPPDAATFQPEGGEAAPLGLGRAVTPGLVRVSSAGRLMLFDAGGLVLVVLGPAEIIVERDEIGGGLQILPRSGRLALTGDGPTNVVLVVLLSETPAIDAELTDFRGQLLLERTPEGLTLLAPADGAASLTVGGQGVALPAGQRVLIDAAGTARTEPAGDWAAQRGFTEPFGRQLGVASAQAARGDVETKLFANVIAWDRYAGAAYVSTRLRERSFAVEIRQNVQTVTATNRSSQRGGQVQTAPFPGANAVPIVSPAAASVQDVRFVGQGVTAIRLNAEATRVLEATGSRGLGFLGLRQLAIPGIGAGGVRTIGPAGLGAP